ncbi:MAG: hypothetical protein R2834_03240 [Rhodothermales bacterium]
MITAASQFATQIVHALRLIKHRLMASGIHPGAIFILGPALLLAASLSQSRHYQNDGGTLMASATVVPALPSARVDETSHYADDLLEFSYPAAWSVDSTYTDGGTHRYILRIDEVSPPTTVTISVRGLTGGAMSYPASRFIIDAFDRDETLAHYYLRPPKAPLIGASLEQLLFSGTTPEETAVRGLKTVFKTRHDQLVTVTLRTTFRDTYSNNMQTEILRDDYDAVVQGVMDHLNR